MFIDYISLYSCIVPHINQNKRLWCYVLQCTTVLQYYINLHEIRKVSRHSA